MRPAATWVFLASGPSQCAQDIETVRQYIDRVTVVAINNQIFAAPWADVLYSCDRTWFKHYADQIAPDCRAMRVSSDVLSERYGARIVKMERGEGLGHKAIRSGNNSGYQALNWAYLQGMRHAILLGYDMKWGPRGEKHNHPDHPKEPHNLGNFGCPDLCARKFPALAEDLKAEGIRVINASRETALNCFPRMPLAAALETTARHGGF